eukprot:SAG31_NODE_14068_length_829_cov_0.884932_2_plen_74_part_01
MDLNLCGCRLGTIGLGNFSRFELLGWYDFKLLAVDFSEEQGLNRFALIIEGDKARYDEELISELRMPMVLRTVS